MKKNDDPNAVLIKQCESFAKLLEAKGATRRDYNDLNNFEWHAALFFRSIKEQEPKRADSEFLSMKEDLSKLKSALQEDALFTPDLEPSYEALEQATSALKLLL